MIGLESIIPFFIASLLLALAPGPDNIFVLTQSAVNGKKAGVAVTFGLCTGVIFHTTAVALGIAVFIQNSAVAFSALKFLGAGYLVYLAWQAYRTSSSVDLTADPLQLSLRKLYFRGIFMNVTNPKVSLFFLAFLPQFADPARGPVGVQIFILGSLFILAAIPVFGSIALLSGSIGEILTKSPRVNKILNRVAGTVFLALAVKLAITER
ncbi:Lysine exporter protein (LYSE/YGGA) [Desulfatibacillum aliphaticivorans]|uniref:Lysine exporter protein (LYSE/YGGA) n=1 Tax=Desulfatibacillum aliphaticivorans TaxID=218208 RepID=B8F9I2_DESAL|nr:LysE family translocator [Desulfatibacillum aliphaticivorans]ACL02928.1 Lysine exporter protein (LYSE/YGGA) [Desulfatibacillum aliphaticivorans]